MRALLASIGAVVLAFTLGCGSSDESSAKASGGGGSGASGGAGGSGGAIGGAAGAGAIGGSAGGGGVAGGGGSTNAIKTVWVILMENKAWCEITPTVAPYIHGTLLPQGSSTSNYKGPLDGNLHPSLPNYIWMEAGDSLGITNDNDPAQNHQSTTDHLVNYLDKAGVTWKSYQEDITGTVCPLTSVGEYKPKHNPMIYFDDVTGTNDPSYPYCIEHNRPFSDLATDLANGTSAQYNFVTPNQCNDMHDACAPTNNPIKQGDDWLAAWIPKFQASPQYQNGGVVIVTWDEAQSTALGLNPCCIFGNCPIGFIVLSGLAKPGYVDPGKYDHSSYLKTMQEIFGAFPLLRHANDPDVSNLASLFSVYP